MRNARLKGIARGGLLATMCFGLATSLGASAAAAEVVQGTLELLWGDPHPAAADRTAQFSATLVTDSGQRLPLEPDSARRAAGDLYALSGRRVAVELASARKSSPLREAAIIVAADGFDQVLPKATADERVMAAAPVLGLTRWVTLMCKFADKPEEQKAKDFFRAQYGSAPGELGHYWKEVSYGKVDLAGSDAFGWFVLPQPRDFYVTKDANGKDKANLSQLFRDCSAAADAEVSFAGVQGINQMFNADLDGSAWGGSSCAPLDGTNTCKSVTWNPPWAFNNLAPLAHEMGHGYGLPHSDNSDGDSDTYDNPWDVMSDAWRNAATSSAYGTLPKHINIYQRERLGWVEAARKQSIAATNDTRVQILLDFADATGSGNKQMVVLALPAQGDPFQNVVYTVEARRRVGTYESKLAGDAVIIHALQNFGTAKSQDADVPPANVANNEGSMFKVGEMWNSPDPLQTHWVIVEAATATGFRVSVGPKPRVTGGPGQPRVAPSAAASSAPSAVAAAQPVQVATRVPSAQAQAGTARKPVRRPTPTAPNQHVP